MTYQEIKDACNHIACHPNENPPVANLNLLVAEAKKLGYSLAFHIGHNLLKEPYIQGYTLDKQATNKP